MELSKDKIIAVTVWYNPEPSDAQTIALYNRDVCSVIVVDNSAADNASFIHAIPGLDNVEYIPLLENTGIAKAQNVGCKRALELGAEWALTMDQDSQWTKHTVSQFITEANQYELIGKVGIITPYHDVDGDPTQHHLNGRFELKNVVMSSGNLLRLKAWQQAGGFREDFFIDSVDDEMCCHIRQLGYIVVRANNIFLSHHLGEPIRIVPVIHHEYIPHKAWRYYYIARNIRRMMRLYPDLQKYYAKAMRKYVKRLLLYD